MRRTVLRRRLAVSTVAVGLALATACENPVEEPTGVAESAVEDATGDGGLTDEEGLVGETPAEDLGDEAAGTVEDLGQEAAGTTETLTQEAVAEVQSQLGALGQAIPQEQIEMVVNEVCSAIESGNVEAGQQVLADRFGVDQATTEGLVDYLNTNVCTA